METNRPDATNSLLAELAADRATLADRAKPPRWLAPGFGLIAAAYVIGPALGEGYRTSIPVLAFIAAVVLVALYYRATGIRISRVGAAGWGILAGALIGSLVLLSVSFGLVSFGLHWWVIVTAVVAFALVTWLATRFTASAVDRVRRDR